jgi:hypothetical protein
LKKEVIKTPNPLILRQAQEGLADTHKASLFEKIDLPYSDWKKKKRLDINELASWMGLVCIKIRIVWAPSRGVIFTKATTNNK